MTQTTTSKKRNKRSRKQSEQNPSSEFLGNVTEQMIASGDFCGADAFERAFGEFGKKFLEAALGGELAAQLEGIPKEDASEKSEVNEIRKGEPAEEPAEKPYNKRNGLTPKTVRTPLGKIRVNMPRDRENTFEPIILPKHRRSHDLIDEEVIALYAQGMTTRDIAGFVRSLYDTSVGAEYVSRVTEYILHDVDRWQMRPLASVYTAALFDTMRIKIFRGAGVKNVPVQLAVGVRTDGTCEVLGLWIAKNEGGSVWNRVFNDLKARGVEEIHVAVTDGLAGTIKDLMTAFPQTTLKTN